MGSLAAGSAAAMGTGAFSAAEIRDRTMNVQVSGDESALIQLIPGHKEYENSSVSEERVYTEDGQLGISFDDSGDENGGGGTGINPDSTYQVGAIGDNADDALDLYSDPPSADDVLYGAANSSGDSDKNTGNDPAFVLGNASDVTYDLQLTWNAKNGNSPNSNSNVGAAIVSDVTSPNVTAGGTKENVAGFVLAVGTDGGYEKATLNMGPGTTVGLSLIAVVGDVDPGNVDDWLGTLEIYAEEAV